MARIQHNKPFMLRFRQWLCRCMRKLAYQHGIAYLEFAMAMPFLMALFLGGVEVTRYLQAAQKVDKLTHTIVDLVAQAPTISVPDLNQIMLASGHVMTPLDFANDGVMIISCVGYNTLGQLVVKWQYKGGGALNRDSQIGTTNGSASLPAGFTVDQRDNVIIAESYFVLDPLINATIVSPIEFYRTAYYLPRLGELDQLSPS